MAGVQASCQGVNIMMNIELSLWGKTFALTPVAQGDRLPFSSDSSETLRRGRHFAHPATVKVCGKVWIRTDTKP